MTNMHIRHCEPAGRNHQGESPPSFPVDKILGVDADGIDRCLGGYPIVGGWPCGRNSRDGGAGRS